MATTTSGVQPVSFTWQASDATTGTLKAFLPAGRTYSGPYVQITESLAGRSVTPLWGARDEGWPAWPDVDSHGNTEYGQHYTHRVVASLMSPGGDHMRCRLRLSSRGAGMSGGGKGECQLANGETVEAEFPAK